MSGILTKEQLIGDIDFQYQRLKEARSKDEQVLAGAFETLMNESLDAYSDFIKFSGGAALTLAQES